MKEIYRWLWAIAVAFLIITTLLFSPMAYYCSWAKKILINDLDKRIKEEQNETKSHY